MCIRTEILTVEDLRRVESVKILLSVETSVEVSNKKGSVKKRKTSINRRRVFKIALEGGRDWKDGKNGSFTWESFDYSMLLSC